MLEWGEMERGIEPGRIRPLKRAEYERLAEWGAFDRERVELIRGLVVRMSPRTPEHDWAVTQLHERLLLALRGRAVVRSQAAIVAADESKPEPDIQVLPPGDYRYAHPDRALLLVEVAHTSLEYDRTVKAELYAEGGVPEYWIVDLVNRVVEIRDRIANGRYARMRSFTPGETVSPGAYPDVEIEVAGLFP